MPRRLPGQLPRPPRDPRRQVGDPLAIAADLHDRRQPPQVRCDRLEKGEDSQAFPLDADLRTVGFFLGVLDLGDDLEPPIAERLDAFLERVDDGPGHGQELAPEILLVLDGVPDGWCRGRSG